MRGYKDRYYGVQGQLSAGYNVINLVLNLNYLPDTASTYSRSVQQVSCFNCKFMFSIHQLPKINRMQF